jgi:glycosyltransferase A (GT-A) superfamily protein (DUF2064 family)
MKPIAIVFARAPRLGTVKRRLARGIGDRAALRFHAATLNRLLRALARDGQFQVVLAITPDRARVRVPSGVAVIGQGRGDIGVRMARALGAAQAVFGPARDGGYWLVGLGPLRPARPFAGARWSTRHALADTLRNFPGRRVASLRELDDVDDLDAWTAYQAADDRNAVSSNPSSVSSAHWSRIM